MIKECPNHEGRFDCTPFCRLCEGEQEYETDTQEEVNKMNATVFERGLYFAQDGSWGDATGIVIIPEILHWQNSDFELLSEVGDNERADLALAINAWILAGRPDINTWNPEGAVLTYLLHQVMGN